MLHDLMRTVLAAPAAMALAGAALLPAMPLAAQDDTPGAVSALGRLEPDGGIQRLAAPSLPGITSGVVVRELRAEEGDTVTGGQILAVADIEPLLDSAVAEAKASLELARRRAESARMAAESACVLARVRQQEAERRSNWRESNVASEEEAERASAEAEAGQAECAAARSEAVAEQAAVGVAQARVQRARAEHEQAFIRAPADGTILKVLAYPGELVIPGTGAFEFGRVDRMLAIAEVYETDVARLEVGQRAEVRSPALPENLTGVVHHIRAKVEKADEIGTDPAARKDARVVEVEVLLDDPGPASGLSQLQVTVIIHAD